MLIRNPEREKKKQFCSDSVWVIIDRLIKFTHFLPLKTTYTTSQYAKLYLEEIVYLNGVPFSIISGRGAQFIGSALNVFQV